MSETVLVRKRFVIRKMTFWIGQEGRTVAVQ